MDLRNFLDKLRKKSKEEKIIILWAIMVPLCLLFFFLWINIVKNSINNLSNTNLPNIEIENFLPQENIKEVEEIKKLFNEEELKKMMEEVEDSEEFKKMIEEVEKEKLKEDNREIINEENNLE